MIGTSQRVSLARIYRIVRKEWLQVVEECAKAEYSPAHVFDPAHAYDEDCPKEEFFLMSVGAIFGISEVLKITEAELLRDAGVPEFQPEDDDGQ